MKNYCQDQLQILKWVYSRFPYGYFPGWFFSRNDVSRVVIFPDETISYD